MLLDRCTRSSRSITTSSTQAITLHHMCSVGVVITSSSNTMQVEQVLCIHTAGEVLIATSHSVCVSVTTSYWLLVTSCDDY